MFDNSYLDVPHVVGAFIVCRDEHHRPIGVVVCKDPASGRPNLPTMIADRTFHATTRAHCGAASILVRNLVRQLAENWTSELLHCSVVHHRTLRRTDRLPSLVVLASGFDATHQSTVREPIPLSSLPVWGAPSTNEYSILPVGQLRLLAYRWRVEGLAVSANLKRPRHPRVSSPLRPTRIKRGMVVMKRDRRFNPSMMYGPLDPNWAFQHLGVAVDDEDHAGVHVRWGCDGTSALAATTTRNSCWRTVQHHYHTNDLLVCVMYPHQLP